MTVSHPDQPAVTDLVQGVYDEVEPITYADPQNEWATLRFIQAWMAGLQELDDIVRDTDLGPGWSAVMDPDRVPDSWLPWFAQFVGLALNKTLTPGDQRAAIQRVEGFRRGSTEAMRAAAVKYLTGTKYLIFTERLDDNAYRLGVRTLVSETPDTALVLSALLSQKPAGIVLDYATTDISYDAIRIAYPTYTSVLAETDYNNYSAMLSHLPSYP